MAYEFTEIALGAHVGCVGFALDIRDKENLEKNSQSLQSIIDNILDYCTSALIIIDSKKKINEYNQKFIQMFGLDNEWLATKPLYLELLDKLRELKKIPEVKDFKDYKELQLRLLQEMTSPQTRFLHLANGKVLKCSIIPTKSGNTIVMYEDTTEIVNTERIYNELQSVYHVTLNSLNVPVANFSANGRIRYYNQKLASLLQITEDDLISLPHFKVIFDKSTLDSQEKELLKSEIISALESRKNKTFSFLGYDVNIKAMPDTSALLIFNPR
jgi:PAS domain-containing protein